MRKEGRFVVDGHVHITTLYKRIEESEIRLGGGYIYELYDNSPLCLYDMDNYGVDMCVLLPSWPGTLNEWQAKLVDRFPDKFAACCSDQTLRLRCARGEAQNVMSTRSRISFPVSVRPPMVVLPTAVPHGERQQPSIFERFEVADRLRPGREAQLPRPPPIAPDPPPA